MAKVGGGFNLVLVVSVLGAVVAFSAAKVEGLDAVGGKQEIQDVKSNGEIQQLGRYCVAEYNKGIKEKMKNKQETSGVLLSFSEVVKAERQVVAGLKYYLRIAAANPSGKIMTFEAQVVIKPRERVKELVTFAPTVLSK